MLRQLNIDLRLRLIAELTESVRRDQPKEKIDGDASKSLFGAWSDADDSNVKHIKRG